MSQYGTTSTTMTNNCTSDSITTMKQASIEELDGVTPTKQDILMGRGNSHKNHPGNIIFQALIKKYRKQYFQVDTLVNKRNTIVEIISQCQRNGARFLEQKPTVSSPTTLDTAVPSETKKSDDDSKSLVWTVLTKERTFRKVSLAIQYRQRCNASSSSSTTTPSALSPTHPTCTAPASSISPQAVPSKMMSLPPLSCSEKLSPSNFLDQSSFGYGYHHQNASLIYGAPLPSNATATQRLLPPVLPGVETNSQHRVPIMMPNHMSMSSSNIHSISNDEFTSGYEDSNHWTNGNNNTTTSSPWSLPFLSQTMSTLPPFQSYLRQRNAMEQPQQLSNHKLMMMQQRPIHTNDSDHYYQHHRPLRHSNMPYIVSSGPHGDDLEVVATPGEIFPKRHYHQQQRRQPCYAINADMNDVDEDHLEDDDTDPVPIADIFPKQQQAFCQNIVSWTDEPNHHHHNHHNDHRWSQQTYVPERQPPTYTRRVSNFDENDNHNHRIHTNHHDHDELLSKSSASEMAATIGTTDMKEFHHIIHCNSSSSDDDSDNNHHKHHHNNGNRNNKNVVADDDDDDQHSITSYTSHLFGRGSCSDDSILHNDLCLSPISFSTITATPTTTSTTTTKGAAVPIHDYFSMNEMDHPSSYSSTGVNDGGCDTTSDDTDIEQKGLTIATTTTTSSNNKSMDDTNNNNIHHTTVAAASALLWV